MGPWCHYVMTRNKIAISTSPYQNKSLIWGLVNSVYFLKIVRVTFINLPIPISAEYK